MRNIAYILGLAACDPTTPDNEVTPTTSVEAEADTDTDADADTDTAVPLETDVRNYIFGHSLLLHSETANVPLWLSALADEAGFQYQMSGQYGLMDTHADNLPPVSQWGVPGVPPAWDEDHGVAFSDVGFNVVLLTEANFRQYYPPDETDPDGFLSESSVDSTLRVLDWVDGQAPGARYLIYESWPDMGGYTSADFSSRYPTASELRAYHEYTQGSFHDWWLDYHDAVRAARPGADVGLVPVGPILATLLAGRLSDQPPEVFYEDDAPHGTPTLYFLAGLVTYTAVYGVQPPEGLDIPDTVVAPVRERYPEISAAIWEHMQDFRDEDGHSLVWN